MKRQLTAVKMGEKENPATMFEEFHRLANLFNDPGTGLEISQDDFMAQVFIAAPDYYQSVLNSESRLRGTRLTLDDLETAMTQLWRSTYGKDATNGKDDTSGEIVLANPSFKKKGGRFQKKFYGKGRNVDLSQVTCYNCGRKGHYADKCRAPRTGGLFSPRSQEVGAAQAQAKAKSKGKKGNQSMEILLCSITKEGINELSPTVQSLLQDEEIFLLDSGATYNSTFSKVGMIDMVPATSDTATICANGEISQPEAFGILPITVCNKHGSELFNAKLSNTAYSPNAPFNLVSVGDKVRNGWKVSFEANAAYLVLGEVRVCFDIVLDTPRGRLFAARFKRPTSPEVNLA
jgi:hypothetical protein